MYTPMMMQYFEIKKQHEDCIVFYRLGDFYEMFFDDAKKASKILGLTLTGRDCGQPERAPMCGVPYHSCDTYIAKLIKAGCKVAICEQVEDPKTAKGIVKRDIVRVVTPGTITIPDVVEESKNNFLVCGIKSGANFALSAVDASTGELYATEYTGESAKLDFMNELSKYTPSEVIYNQSLAEDKVVVKYISDKFSAFTQRITYECEKYDLAVNKLKDHFGVNYHSREVEDNQLASVAVAVLLCYLEETQMNSIEHIGKTEYYSSGQYLGIDSVARYNLELTKTMRDGVKRGSLLGVLDKTCTAMGARMLNSWISQPLVSCGHIKRRQDAVEEFSKNISLREELRSHLKEIYDMERIISKIEYRTVNARDLLALRASVSHLPAISKCFSECTSSLLMEVFTDLDLLEDILTLIDSSIETENTPFSIREGGIIKQGYDEQLDTWKDAKNNGADRLHELEAREREITGIKNLKVTYNKVFGYYIEVTKSYLDQVPDRYIRKQTLTNAERYITEELKELEDLVLRSTEKIVAREYNIFCEIRDTIKKHTERLQKTAKVISTIDVLASLGLVAAENNYVKPLIDTSMEIEIKDGRHPVVEDVSKDVLFVPNDTLLDDKDNTFCIITGPNMAGKSTYMRQVAIIVIMAQMGSFVPATYAKIGIVDRVFTRIGASDDLASGQSTFMVEMNEVSNILNNATQRSLLILDEIGRGTSTFDGLSIAWAIVEYISNKKKVGARTLFATHYHELTVLEEKIKSVKNYYITAKKRGDDIVFLRKIVRGGADESYGIEVAKLAGICDDVITNAKKILATLETDEQKPKKKKQVEDCSVVQENEFQLDMLSGAKDELIEQIKKIDINILSPIEAMNKLFELKKEAEKL